jgi:hypothetical protein
MCTWSVTTRPPTKPPNQDWLARHPLHFTPTGSLCINQLERWFGYLTDQMIAAACTRACRSSKPTSAPGSGTGTQTPQPFTWAKGAEEVLDSLARYIARISGAEH